MVVINDRDLHGRIGNIEIVNRVGRREITHAIHDIDGTYSLIRQWRPVMSRSLYYAMSQGLKGEFDSVEKVRELSEQTGSEPLPETDRFCVESAGLSALTQMEWAIRRGIEIGTIAIPGYEPGEKEEKTNSEIIRRIWNGEEVFDDFSESEKLKAYLRENTPRLFKLYEQVLNSVCRDRNLAKARRNPAEWLVPGSLEFIRYLHKAGVKSYFVTGAVIEVDESGYPLKKGMYEEVLAVGLDIGAGKEIERLYGSTWDEKVPKREVVKRLSSELGVPGENILVVGDGRAEISVGVEINAVTISRIPENSPRDREIHIELGTNYILADYTSPELFELISTGPAACR
jgi:phosphoserine phosphatase